MHRRSLSSPKYDAYHTPTGTLIHSHTHSSCSITQQHGSEPQTNYVHNKPHLRYTERGLWRCASLTSTAAFQAAGSFSLKKATSHHSKHVRPASRNVDNGRPCRFDNNKHRTWAIFHKTSFAC